jgi:hypothetical protein
LEEPIANVHVGLAENHATGGVEALDHMGIVRRHEIRKHLRATGGEPVARAEDVLVGKRNAREPAAFATCDAVIGRACLREALFRVDGDERIERAGLLDAREEQSGQFDAAGLARGKRGAQFGNGGVVHERWCFVRDCIRLALRSAGCQVPGNHSITRGTR